MEVLNEFWKSLPVLRRIPKNDFNFILTPIRLEILEILQQGIKTSDLKRNTRRYGLSANEIRKEIKSEVITYNNIYFHLEKMEEIGVIKTLGQIQRGRRFTSYFGRTARTFIPKEEDNLGYLEVTRMASFVDLVKRFSTQISEAQIQKISDTIELINRPNLKSYQNWLEFHISKFEELPVDFRKIMELYYVIKNLNSDTLASLTELGKILDII